MLINELTEDRKVKDAVIKYLRELGHEVLDVTPPVNYTSISSKDLSYGVNKANSWGADLFVSIHFNKAYNSYNGAIGSEVCVYSNNAVAERVINALAGLGFKNRGQKVRKELYELKNTSMNAMIVETCFVEATEDVALYRRLGPDTIGKAIAEAIANKKVSGSNSTSDIATQNGNNEILERSYKETGLATVLASKLNVRNKPSTENNTPVATYKKGEKINYDSVYVTNKYYYISYISKSGVRRYVASRNRITGEKYLNCI